MCKRIVRFSGLACVAALVFLSCGRREDLLRCVSPDKIYVATFYRQYGGGAAGWQDEYVSIQPAAGGRETVVFQMSHGYDIILAWHSPTQLEVAYPNSARVVLKESHFQRNSGLLTPTVEIAFTPKMSSCGKFIEDNSRCGN